MKKAHKLISAVLVSTMVLSMTACGSGEKTYKVGILQQLEHPALDQATQGFQDALTKLMGDSVTFDVQNAQGEQANCSSIATTFVSNNYDLILANATTALPGFRGGHQHNPGTRNLRDGLRNRARH